MGFRTVSDRGAYLLVVRDDSSFVFHLPRSGTITIGRAPDVELQIEHASVSRRHASLRVEGGAITLTDLGSHNGTRINGELIDGPRPLASGDVATVGDVACVVHISHPDAPSHTVYPDAGWRRRLTEELERAVEHQRSVGVLVVSGPQLAVADVMPSLRLIDVVGTAVPHEVMVLMPEASTAETRAAATRLARLTPGARVGMAMCPDDGSDVDAILLAARSALRGASAGTVAVPADAVQRIELGERQVLVGDPAMSKVYALLERLAGSMLPVLILGESGVGKENAAFAVHHWSRRRGPFVAVNCAALPETLVESELFGHEKGAFTGATAAKAGLFESAAGGTVFLDEVGELSPAIQAKMLRLLENKTIMRVGETRARPIDVRIVAATNRAIDDEVAAGRFRQDLFFRLGGATVLLPPLRDRRSEIPLFARAFLAAAGRPSMELGPSAMRALLAHDWPGNVRELKNTIEYVVATAPDDHVEPSDLPERLGGVAAAPDVTSPPVVPAAPFRPIAEEIRELEIRRMREALAAAGGVKTRAAALIDMPIRTFNFKLRQYKL